MIQFDNLAEFSNALDACIEDWEQLVDTTFRGLVLDTFNYVVHGTPEWSGNLAANWKLTVGAPASGYDDTVFKELSPSGVIEEPFSRMRPNAAAISYAMQNAKHDIPLIHAGVDVFITNNTPYASMVEQNSRSGKTFIRSVNLPIEMTNAAGDRAERIGEISEARALEYSRMAL